VVLSGTSMPSNIVHISLFRQQRLNIPVNTANMSHKPSTCRRHRIQTASGASVGALPPLVHTHLVISQHTLPVHTTIPSMRNSKHMTTDTPLCAHSNTYPWHLILKYGCIHFLFIDLILKHDRRGHSCHQSGENHKRSKPEHCFLWRLHSCVHFLHSNLTASWVQFKKALEVMC
jgi:hypothetical protein